MINRLTILCLFLFLIQTIYSQDAGIPFAVEMEEITYDDWPGLHSFSFAEWDEYWVFIGGRRNGLHGFFTLTGFPESEANDQLWVMDRASGEYWSYSVLDFPDEWRDFLRGTNPQYVQLGQYLYIVGGYGKDNTTGEFVTFDYLAAIDLSVLVPAVIAGGSPLSAFRMIHDPRMKVCGGEIHELGDKLYLFGGHDFNGLYNQLGNPTFTQEYTSEIREFRIDDDGINMAIVDYVAVPDPEFHRRDLSFAPAMTVDGQPALAAFGGVFKPDADEAYLHPIYISQDMIEIDGAYNQKMSQYTCPVAPLFDETNQLQYYLFFGGISLHFQDEATQMLVEDPLMPFIDEVTAFVRYPNGSTEEFVLSTKFDELLGANAKFIPASNVPSYENGVVQYDELSGRTLLGYIFGGIRAAIPNITPSSASNRLFEVYATVPLATGEPPAMDDLVHVFPNPSGGVLTIKTSPDFSPTGLSLLDARGMEVLTMRGEKETMFDRLRSQWSHLSSGIYFLHLRDDKQVVVRQLIRW